MASQEPEFRHFAIVGWVEFVFCEVDEILADEEMVNVGEDDLLLAAFEIDQTERLAVFARVGEVDEMPDLMSITVLHVLVDVGVATANQVAVAVGRERVDSAVTSSQPNCQIPIAKQLGVPVHGLVIGSHAESQMPWLLIRYFGPLEPPSNRVLARELIGSIAHRHRDLGISCTHFNFLTHDLLLALLLAINHWHRVALRRETLEISRTTQKRATAHLEYRFRDLSVKSRVIAVFSCEDEGQLFRSDMCCVEFDSSNN